MLSRRQFSVGVAAMGLGPHAAVFPQTGSKLEILINSLESEQNKPKFTLEFLSKNVEYRLDNSGEYEWSPPEVTLSRGYGDCSDFACAAFHVLQPHEHECRLAYCESAWDYLGRVIETHLVLVVKRGSDWYVIDQRTPRKMYKSIDRSDLKFLASWNRLEICRGLGNGPAILPKNIQSYWTQFLKKTQKT